MKKAKRSGTEGEKKAKETSTTGRTTRGVNLGNLNENALAKKSLDADAIEGASKKND
jgi:hypothetical protein